ncbi:uncharacterized protein N7484_007903 [Penicillium longicatenatum]|uniref:uncharacterized protein n=1 Tax=Penicillium longicatenatum TaxID=1561947 RepID=UPI002546DC42|nr:uncharacterized protein N7484_007903 [Penicillium longicatenatum]KAJ5640041.1 hypothetical protein N7484_007903 [Penicillium longicatenatum]
MTPAPKASLVKRLRCFHNVYVWAFEDSPIDIEMLKAANKAIVVAGNESTRSATMDDALRESIGHEGFEPRQLLLPSWDHVQPRLTSFMRLTDESFLNPVFARHNRLHVFHATKHSGPKIMMTAMHDATISGPALRQAHHRVGWYLTMRFYTEMVGTGPYSITHVQD